GEGEDAVKVLPEAERAHPGPALAEPESTERPGEPGRGVQLAYHHGVLGEERPQLAHLGVFAGPDGARTCARRGRTALERVGSVERATRSLNLEYASPALRHPQSGAGDVRRRGV